MKGNIADQETAVRVRSSVDQRGTVSGSRVRAGTSEIKGKLLIFEGNVVG